MPIDSDALEATLRTLRLTPGAVPTRWDEDTADEMLHMVQMTFCNLVAAVLEEPLPSGQPGDSMPLAIPAALHGRAIAGLLAAIADTGADGWDAAAVIEHALDVIAQISTHEEDRPKHETPAEYVRGTAATFSFITRILLGERGFSIDPADPRGPVTQPDEAMTGDDAAGMLLWCAAAAQCIAATLQPDYRIRPPNTP